MRGKGAEEEGGRGGGVGGGRKGGEDNLQYEEKIWPFTTRFTS